MHGGTPLGPVHGGLFPGVGGDGKRFQGCFYNVFEALLLASMGPLSLLLFTIEEAFWEPMVWHAGYMSCPA